MRSRSNSCFQPHSSRALASSRARGQLSRIAWQVGDRLERDLHARDASAHGVGELLRRRADGGDVVDAALQPLLRRVRQLHDRAQRVGHVHEGDHGVRLAERLVRALREALDVHEERVVAGAAARYAGVDAGRGSARRGSPGRTSAGSTRRAAPRRPWSRRTSSWGASRRRSGPGRAARGRTPRSCWRRTPARHRRGARPPGRSACRPCSRGRRGGAWPRPARRGWRPGGRSTRASCRAPRRRRSARRVMSPRTQRTASGQPRGRGARSKTVTSSPRPTRRGRRSVPT